MAFVTAACLSGSRKSWRGRRLRVSVGLGQDRDQAITNPYVEQQLRQRILCVKWASKLFSKLLKLKSVSHGDRSELVPEQGILRDIRDVSVWTKKEQFMSQLRLCEPLAFSVDECVCRRERRNPKHGHRSAGKLSLATPRVTDEEKE